MSLPAFVREKCREAMRRPVKSMQERAKNVHNEAYQHGYIYDHGKDGKAGEWVYVGTENNVKEEEGSAQ